MNKAITKHTTYKFYARTVRELTEQLADIVAEPFDGEFTIEGFGGSVEITVTPHLAGLEGATE